MPTLLSMISGVPQATATETQQELGMKKEQGKTSQITSYITQLRKYQKLYTLGKIGEWTPKD